MLIGCYGDGNMIIKNDTVLIYVITYHTFQKAESMAQAIYPDRIIINVFLDDGRIKFYFEKKE